MLPLLTISTWRCPFSWVIPSRHHRGLPIWSNVDDLGIPHDITAISAGHRRRVYHHHTLAIGPINCTWLVVSSPLKNMSSSVGMIIPTYSQSIWKVIKAMFQTTNQVYLPAPNSWVIRCAGNSGIFSPHCSKMPWCFFCAGAGKDMTIVYHSPKRENSNLA